MAGVLKHLFRRALLHDAAIAHDDHPVGEGPHHLQIVANEQIPQVVQALQVAQEVHDLRLHGHVEGGRGFVQHHEARFQHHGPRDGNALPLAAGEFVGVAIHVRRVQAHFRQCASHLLAALGFRHAGVVNAEPLLDDVLHRHARRQGTVWVLEHHLHVLAQRS